MSMNGSPPVCEICGAHASRVRLTQHGAGELAYWLCQSCEDAADEVLTNSPPAGTPYMDDMKEASDVG